MKDRVLLEGVALLGVGTWDNRPRPIPVANIDLLCAAHDWRTRRHPIPLQCEHDGTEVGTVEGLRVVGDELVGDLAINQLGVDLIRRGIFKAVSVATHNKGIKTRIKHVALVAAGAYSAQRPLVEYLPDHNHPRNDAMSDLHEIRGLPIFKSGRWNGDEYTTADLDAMVNAFDQVGFRPPVKLGHDSTTGGRAWGWVTRIWRKGQQLFADLSDIPQNLFDQIRQRSFDNVSAEIMWNLDRNGRTFSRVLSGLALLGGEVPAVDLPPIRSAQLLGVDHQVRSYAMPLDHTPTNPRAAEATLHNLALQRAHDADCDYAEALHHVMTDPCHGALVGTFNQRTDSAARRADASIAIHNLAVERFKPQTPQEYRDAVEKITRDPRNADLVRAWTGQG